MDIQLEIEYCHRREAEERVAASLASEITAHDAHFQLAERYADRIFSLVEMEEDAPRPPRRGSARR